MKLYIVYTTHCSLKLYIDHCILHFKYCRLETGHCTWIQHCKLKTAQCTLHNAHWKITTANSKLKTANFTLGTLQTAHISHCSYVYWPLHTSLARCLHTVIPPHNPGKNLKILFKKGGQHSYIKDLQRQAAVCFGEWKQS